MSSLTPLALCPIFCRNHINVLPIFRLKHNKVSDEMSVAYESIKLMVRKLTKQSTLAHARAINEWVSECQWLARYEDDKGTTTITGSFDSPSLCGYSCRIHILVGHRHSAGIPLAAGDCFVRENFPTTFPTEYKHLLHYHPRIHSPQVYCPRLGSFGCSQQYHSVSPINLLFYAMQWEFNE